MSEELLFLYKTYKTIPGNPYPIDVVKDFITKVGTDDAVVYALKNYTLSHDRSPFGCRCKNHVIWNKRKPEHIMQRLDEESDMDDVKEILTMAKDMDYVMGKMTDCSTSRRDICRAMSDEKLVWYYDELLKTENKTELHKKPEYCSFILPCIWDEEVIQYEYYDGVEEGYTSDSE